MKSRMMKSRPRLVPKEDYQAANVNLWVDDKESDITSVSSASSDESEADSIESSMVSDDMEDHTVDHHDEETLDEDDDDEDEEDDMESAMEQTLEPNPTEITKESRGGLFAAEEEEVTPLYKAIAGEEWDSVLAFLETGSWGWKWSSICDQLYHVTEKSVDEQVRTWVTTNKSEDSKTEIRRLPLHAAVAKGAPFKIIEALIMHFAKGAENPDSQGNHALHLAFERGLSIETITFLMHEFPEAVHIQNNLGKVPTECGNANGLAKLVQLGVNATKMHVESQLTKEKGNLEEDRKQLLEVTKELMNLKKIVAERERNMTKDNFLYQKQHLNSAISQLTKLKTDLDQHEDNVLQHHLVADKKRMDGVLGELQKTKGELEMIKSEKNQGGDAPVAGQQQQQMPISPVTQQKKKKTKKSKKNVHKVEKEGQKPAAVAPSAPADPSDHQEEIAKERDETEITDDVPVSPRDAPTINNWQSTSLLTVDTNEQQQFTMEPTLASPSSNKSEGRSPKKMKKNVALRFKKKMNWRKEKQLLAADNE